MTSPAIILVVDDEVRNCRLVEAMLRSEGYVTSCATSGEAALAEIKQCPPDLILLDIVMPGMDGYQLAGLLKANPATASIPIIMVTAQIDRRAHMAGLDAGAEEFLTKPIDRAELRLRVRNLLRLKSYNDFLQNHNVILEQQVLARTADLQRFRSALDTTADAIFLIDRGTMRFIEANATACNMLGYTREELLRQGPEQIGFATLEELERVYDSIIADNLGNDLTEIEIRRKDGSRLEVELRCQAQRFGTQLIIVGVLRDITERKAAEQQLYRLTQLRLSEAATQVAILNALPANIALLDTQGTIVSVNEAWRRVASTNLLQGQTYGIGLNYLASCDSAKGNEAAVAQKVAAGIRSVLAGEVKHFAIEYPSHLPSERRWFLLMVSPLADDGSNGAVVMYLDVTAERQAKESLEASELRFRQMAENIRDVFYLIEADSNSVLYVSPAYQDIWGRSCESLYACPGSWIEALHPDDRAATYEKYKQGMAAGSYEFEYRVVRPDGSIRWVKTKGYPVRDDAGKMIRICGVAEDVTEQMLASQALRESERRFRDLLGSVQLVSVMLDLESRITYCNDYLLRVTGWQREEVIGADWFELFAPSALGDMRQVFMTLLANLPEASHHENEILTRAGERRLIRWNSSVLRSGVGDVIGTASIGEDITEQKRAELEILDLTVKLEQRVLDRTADLEQARNEANLASQAKSSFLATMSHEIRTPMNGVIGMVDILQQTCLQDYQTEMVDLIRDSAYSLLTIIDDILDFSKIEAGRLEIESSPISVTEVVEKACAMLAPLAARKSVELALFVDPTLPATVLGDGLRLRQVLLNLVGNAIKFSSGREQCGQVEVSMVPTERSATHLALTVQVRDNGIGMDEETQARLVSAFSQADTSTTRRLGGTGLGLVISRRLVELMKGDLTLHSRAGQGAAFTVNLRFEIPADEANASNPVSEVAGLACLVVGGASSQAAHIATYLSHGGARVERSATLVEAQRLQARLPAGCWIWVVDDADIPSSQHDHAAMRLQNPAQDIRRITIARGAHHALPDQFPDQVRLDGNVLTYRRLLHAVASVAGRVAEKAVSQQAKPPCQKEEAFSPPAHGDALRQGRLILVAEDNETNQKVILRQLALLGFAADVAATGRIALECWQSRNYALLLTDLHMPEMDGYELATKIRALDDDTCRRPIVALTANALKDEADRCRAAGMDDYLSKPVRLTDLQAILATWLPAVPVVPLLQPPPIAAEAPAADVRVLASLVGDDPAVLLEFLTDFRAAAIVIAQALKIACAKQHLAQASEQAHKLKAAARSVGAVVLGELCVQIEVACDAGSTEAVAVLLPLFELELEKVYAYLDAGPALHPVQHLY
ncbi:PAS domain S-box protein [Chitinimonas arctica]|uniref:Sensory/regulatory protein RpfC n=1 Tax=Chitinimonas arctica TaxID=2594795 RepID=A0A516SCR9_9NEIS|nr:PAS domain S-box protein [Chitinimonas arctica]QDQ25848.1 PAS domain S-box protein [Chitinimonas arctica]